MINQSKRSRSFKSRPVASLPELLALNDVAFVRAAYNTILQREPDPSGLAHFCERLRQGNAKIDLLRAIRESDESVALQLDLAWLDRAISRRKWERNPLVGWLLGGEQNDPNSVRLRIVENQVARMADTCGDRLSEIETAVDRLQFMASRQSDGLIEFFQKLGVRDGSLAGPKTAAEASSPAPMIKIDRGISPRASGFLRMLRNSQAARQSAGGKKS